MSKVPAHITPDVFRGRLSKTFQHSFRRGLFLAITGGLTYYIAMTRPTLSDIDTFGRTKNAEKDFLDLAHNNAFTNFDKDGNVVLSDD